MGANTWLKLCCSLLANAVLFGIGTITVLSIPALSANAIYLLPAVIVLSFVLAPFAGIWVARRMRLRNWGTKRWKEGDVISG